MATFELIPFPADNPPKIEITGEVNRVENNLSIRYTINGEIETILLPNPAAPTRKHDLWKATCFEFFIAIPDQPRYWEFNLSPSSDWNVYVMDAYRQVNMREEAAFQQLPFEFKRANDGLALDISVDLSSLVRAEQTIQLGVTTVIQSKDGSESYWALAHPGMQADFHVRASFIIAV